MFHIWKYKIIQYWKNNIKSVYSHGVNLCLTCLLPCHVIHAQCFSQLFLFHNSWAVNISKDSLTRQTFYVCFITSTANSCTLVALDKLSDPHLDYDFRNKGLRMRGDLITTRPTNLANASQVINAHYITWLHHNYKKQGLKSNFKRITISVDCDINISHFPLRELGMGNARLIN